MLAYGVPSDIVDEYVRMGDSTIQESFKRFNRAIIDLYGKEYLRKPSESEAAEISERNRSRGFPGCLGSIDCMHWRWLNCPKALAGQFKGYKKDGPTLVLEAVVDQDLRFWHAFFGFFVNSLHWEEVVLSLFTYDFSEKKLDELKLGMGASLTWICLSYG
jgi:hypothetical protein